MRGVWKQSAPPRRGHEAASPRVICARRIKLAGRGSWGCSLSGELRRSRPQAASVAVESVGSRSKFLFVAYLVADYFACRQRQWQRLQDREFQVPLRVHTGQAQFA